MARKSNEVWEILPAGAEDDEGKVPDGDEISSDEVVWFMENYETEQPKKQTSRRNER